MICHSYPRKLTLSPAIITCSNLVSARCGEGITENKVFLKKIPMFPRCPHIETMEYLYFGSRREEPATVKKREEKGKR